MNHLKFSLATLLLLSNLNAKEAEVELKEVTVTGETENDPLQKKVGETKKTAKTLEKQQVQDQRDLVKYETGVSVVETGRMGASGYSIRGVDENRVAITIDGLHQAETLNSQGFKEIFEGYGNFNNTRNGVEIETVKAATIRKGADSVKTGSGSLGGSVVFETKDARDFLLDKDYHIGYKTGYSTANNELLKSLSAAGRLKWFDILVIRTQRNGRELENFDFRRNDRELGKRRQNADPYRIKKDSTLIKFGFQPTEEHRFTITRDISKNVSKGSDLSYNLNASRYYDPDVDEVRHTHDSSERKSMAFGYENFSETPFWDSLKISYSDQRIKNRARTDDFCDGGHCKQLQNSSGLQLKDGKIVDRYGSSDIQIKRDPKNGGLTYMLDSKGQRSDDMRLVDPSSVYLDCSKTDCSKPINVWEEKGSYSGVFEQKEAQIEKITKNGFTYGKIKANSDQSLILPTQAGYLRNYWKDRYLNTHTKQLNLDLEKELTLFGVEHSLAYGALYSKSEKSMVNKDGDEARHVQWWNDTLFGTSWGSGEPTDKCYSIGGSKICPTTTPETSFLVPVTTKTGALYFSDEFRVNDVLAFDIGYRYDKIKYKPEYIPGSTPKIPDGLVQGLFIPMPKEPKWWDYPGRYTDPDYLRDKAAYEEALKNNPNQNIALITKKKEFDHHSYALATTIDPLEYLRVQAKYSKGFRAPTADEVYFTFQHPDITILPNPGLKPEIAKTAELALTLHGEAGYISTSFFKTKYKDFIDLVFLRNQKPNTASGYPQYQNINLSTASVHGVEINSKLNLGSVYEPLRGLNVSYKLTYQKGKSGGHPMNAIQPTTAIYGLGYSTPNDKYGADLYITSVAAKKSKDTYNMFWKEEGASNSEVKWRSGDYTVVDFVAFAQPIKNLTLRAGAYNLTNQKYITWESARSIRSYGTSNMIDRTTGLGINRFFSPGRNFKFTFDLRF